jgi:fatty acid desaturase
MAQTINVIVLPIIMNLVLDTNLDGAEGLIGLALDYQFIVLLMMMNLNLINVPYQLKRLSLCIPCIRNFIIRYYSSPVGELDSFDEIREVLNYYEPPAFPIAGAYVYITTVIFQAIFFCYAQPTLLFFLIFNIGCFIIVQKYLLLQRCKIP